MLKVLIWEDYGAYEYLWISTFTNIQSLLTWWQNLPCADIYQYATSDLREQQDNYQSIIQHILPNGELICLQSNQLRKQYHIDIIEYPKIMLDNDYSSYLFYQGKQYYHQGKKFNVNVK